MKTLYRKFIIATILILGISIVIAFILVAFLFDELDPACQQHHRREVQLTDVD